MDGTGVPPEMFETVQRICLGLPETTLRTDRWAHAFQIRRHVFAFLLAPEDKDHVPVPILVVRADPVEWEVLVAVGHPFFKPGGGYGRIGVVLNDETDWDEIAELITESYRVLAPKKLVKLLDLEQEGTTVA